MSPVDSPESNAEKPLNPAFFVLLLGALQLGALFLPVPTRAAQFVLTVVITVVYVGLLVGLAQSVARLKLPPWASAAWLGVCAAAWAGIQFGMLPVTARFAEVVQKVGAHPTPTQILALSYPQVLQDLAMIAGAMFAGSIIARLIRHPNLVGPIGVMIALIDTWGVLFQGPVSKLLSNKATQPVAAKAMASGPHIGGATSGGVPAYSVNLPQIGVGDYLFIALLLCALVNLSMNWRTSSRAMWGGIVVALLALTFTQLPPLPGLIFIGLAAVIPNVKYFQFTREEWFALLYAGIFVVIMTAGIYFGLVWMLPN